VAMQGRKEPGERVHNQREKKSEREEGRGVCGHMAIKKETLDYLGRERHGDE
jgi:hypothetical protein